MKAGFTRVVDGKAALGCGALFVCALEEIQPATLRDNGVAYLLVVATPDALLEQLRRQLPGLEVRVCAVEDAETADVSRFFFEATFALQQRLARGQNALVASQRGLCRAPTIAAAFLVRHAGFSAEEACRHLRRRLPALAIREAFRAQLRSLERFMAAAQR